MFPKLTLSTNFNGEGFGLALEGVERSVVRFYTERNAFVVGGSGARPEDDEAVIQISRLQQGKVLGSPFSAIWGNVNGEGIMTGHIQEVELDNGETVEVSDGVDPYKARENIREILSRNGVGDNPDNGITVPITMLPSSRLYNLVKDLQDNDFEVHASSLGQLPAQDGLFGGWIQVLVDEESRGERLATLQEIVEGVTGQSAAPTDGLNLQQ